MRRTSAPCSQEEWSVSYQEPHMRRTWAPYAYFIACMMDGSVKLLDGMSTGGGGGGGEFATMPGVTARGEGGTASSATAAH